MVKLLAILTSCALLLECLPVRAFGGPIAYNRPNALINIGGQDLWLADPAGNNPPRALFQLDLLSGSNLLSARNPVPRQNLIRLAQEHRDPSIRPQAHDPEPGWR